MFVIVRFYYEKSCHQLDNEEHEQKDSHEIEELLFEIRPIQLHSVIDKEVTKRLRISFNEHEQQVSIKSIFPEKKGNLVSKEEMEEEF